MDIAFLLCWPRLSHSNRLLRLLDFIITLFISRKYLMEIRLPHNISHILIWWFPSWFLWVDLSLPLLWFWLFRRSQIISYLLLLNDLYEILLVVEKWFTKLLQLVPPFGFLYLTKQFILLIIGLMLLTGTATTEGAFLLYLIIPCRIRKHLKEQLWILSHEIYYLSPVVRVFRGFRILVENLWLDWLWIRFSLFLLKHISLLFLVVYIFLFQEPDYLIVIYFFYPLLNVHTCYIFDFHHYFVCLLLINQSMSQVVSLLK